MRYQVVGHSSIGLHSAHNRPVVEQPSDRYEAALRRMPEAHSLALRLRAAGVAEDVICEYLHIEPEGLETLLLLAHHKLAAELLKE
jgi:hypothetical protein